MVDKARTGAHPRARSAAPGHTAFGPGREAAPVQWPARGREPDPPEAGVSGRAVRPRLALAAALAVGAILALAAVLFAAARSLAP